MTRSHLCPSLIISILAQVPLCITVCGCVSVRLGALSSLCSLKSRFLLLQRQRWAQSVCPDEERECQLMAWDEEIKEGPLQKSRQEAPVVRGDSGRHGETDRWGGHVENKKKKICSALLWYRWWSESSLLTWWCDTLCVTISLASSLRNMCLI